MKFKYYIFIFVLIVLSSSCNDKIKLDLPIEEYKNEIWREIGKFGTMQRYNQNFRVNYNLPMRKIPILDWTTIALSYTGIYSWAASPISVQERMGNIIENSNQKQLNGSADLNKLYNKVPYFKKINVSKNLLFF